MNFDHVLNTVIGLYTALAILQLGFFVLGGWVLYMFYRCFRDTADELKRIRANLDTQHARHAPTAQPAPLAPNRPYWMPEGTQKT